MTSPRRRTALLLMSVLLGVVAPAAQASVSGSSDGATVTVTDSDAAPTSNTVTGFGCGTINDRVLIFVGLSTGLVTIPQPAGCGAVTSIVVEMGSGDDTVTRTVSAALPNVASVPVDGGAGNDVLHSGPSTSPLSGGPGDDRFVLTNTGRVAIAVAGGAGTDTIQATGTGFLLSDARLIGTVPASLREIERAELTGTAAGDTFDARSFSGSVVLEGLGGNDQLLAGAGASSLLGGSGDDTLEGGAGGDVLLGGDGTDTLKGNGGADTLEGAAGNDGMDGGPGSDTVKVGADADITLTDAAVTGDGADTLTAVEAATLTAGPGAHTVDATGFTGATRITGGPADDVLLGGSGPDVIRGGAGNDLVRGNLGRDDLGGDAGVDTLSYAGMSSPVGVALGAPSGGPADEPDTLAADFEILEGGTAGDSLTGDAGPNTLLGGPGNDALAGGGGDDSIVGGDGTDTVVAVGDVDLVLTPTALTGLGTDALSTIEAAALAVGPGPHTVNATAFTGPAQITGGPAADVLLGGSGPDLIRGAGGDDLVRGGPGRDDLGGDAGSDTLSYADATTPVVAALGAPSGGPTADPDVLAADFEHLEGGSSRDRLTGDGGPNVLRGGPGNDVLDGAGGPDVHEGGPGNDALLGGPGGPGDGDVHSGGDGIDMINYGGRTTGVRVTVGVGADDGSPGEGDDVRGDIETVVGSKAADVIVAAPAGASSRSSLRAGATGKLFLVAGLSGNDRITGGPGNDALGGGKGDDVVDGGPGNDVLGGGSGKDKLKGAAGNDRIYGHKGADDIDGGAGDDVGFSLDEEADEVDCGPGSDLMLGDPKDVPALAKLAKLKPGKSPKPSSGSTRPVSSGCDKTVAKPDKPKAPGATPSGGDQTCSDGDAIWGNEGDGAGCDPFDPNETLDPNFDEETAGGWIDADGAGFESLFDGLGDDLDFGDFGDEFDDSFFGEGFDDFGDAFGEDLGGDLTVAAGPRITTRSARLDKRRRAGLVVSCPKTAEKRCLGEVTLERPAKKAGKRPTLLGRALFSIPKGKKKTLRVRLPKAKAKKLTKARKGTPTDAVIEARDGGSSLWQSTARVRLRRR